MELYRGLREVGIICTCIMALCLLTLFSGPQLLPEMFAAPAMEAAEAHFRYRPLPLLVLLWILWAFLASAGPAYWLCAERIGDGRRSAAVVALIFAAIHLGLMFFYFFLCAETLIFFPSRFCRDYVDVFHILCQLLAVLVVWGLILLIRDLFRFLFASNRQTRNSTV